MSSRPPDPVQTMRRAVLRAHLIADAQEVEHCHLATHADGLTWYAYGLTPFAWRRFRPTEVWYRPPNTSGVKRK